MANVDWLLRRIESGAPVRISMDYYGQERVLVRRWWAPWTSSIELPRAELERVKRAIGSRRRKRKHSKIQLPRFQ